MWNGVFITELIIGSGSSKIGNEEKLWVGLGLIIQNFGFLIKQLVWHVWEPRTYEVARNYTIFL